MGGLSNLSRLAPDGVEIHWNESYQAMAIYFAKYILQTFDLFYFTDEQIIRFVGKWNSNLVIKNIFVFIIFR